MHDASKVLLGSTGSSAKDVSMHDSDPATYMAGLCVSLANNSSLSLLKSAGRRIGVSLGKSLSDHKKTAVLRAGESVPVRIEPKKASGVATIDNHAHLVSSGGDTVTVAGVAFTAQAVAASLGDATFQAASSNGATATSLAAQINAHATTSPLVKAIASGAAVTIYAKSGGVSGNDIGLTYENLHDGSGITISGVVDDKLSGGSALASAIDYISLGAKAYIHDTTGKVDVSTFDSTISDAVFVSGALTGIDEAGNSVLVALVDMPGGL